MPRCSTACGVQLGDAPVDPMLITPPQFFVLAVLLHAPGLSQVLHGLERRGIMTHEKPRVTRLRPDSHESRSPTYQDGTVADLVGNRGCFGSSVSSCCGVNNTTRQSRVDGGRKLRGLRSLEAGWVIGAPLQHGASNYLE